MLTNFLLILQFPDAASGHRTVGESIGDDTPSLERGHRTPTLSPGPIKQVSYNQIRDCFCVFVKL